MIGAPLGLTGAMVTYVTADVKDGDEDASYSTRLRRGDDVRFKVIESRFVGAEHPLPLPVLASSGLDH